MTNQDKKIAVHEDENMPSDEDIMAAYLLSIKEGDTASNNS
jgi:hypothetical protein